MILISGCPRSGTSMMMRIMNEVFGEDRILGSRKPEKQRKLTTLQEYAMSKKTANKQERAKDMNPNGYFEMQFCVQGIYYRPQFEELLSKPSNKIVKVVSQGLAKSDPDHIDKIVYMVRNPRAVAKSQERLGRLDPMNPDNAPEINGKKVLTRSVKMYNNVTVQASEWIVNHPDIPILLVNYDNMLDNPEEELTRIQEFLGEGDFSKAFDMIDTSLRRSEPVNDEGDEWDFAENLHELLLQGKFQEILDFIEDKRKTLKDKKPDNWFCFRANKGVNKTVCDMCKGCDGTLKNMKRSATNKNVAWVNEPCSYDVLYENITIEESIKNNHWLQIPQDKVKLEREIKYQYSVLERMIETKAKACEIKRQKAWMKRLQEELSGL